MGACGSTAANEGVVTPPKADTLADLPVAAPKTGKDSPPSKVKLEAADVEVMEASYRLSENSTTVMLEATPVFASTAASSKVTQVAAVAAAPPSTSAPPIVEAPPPTVPMAAPEEVKPVLAPAPAPAVVDLPTMKEPDAPTAPPAAAELAVSTPAVVPASAAPPAALSEPAAPAVETTAPAVEAAAPVAAAADDAAPLLASDLLPLSQRVVLADLPEKEVKREGGPLGGVPQEWDCFNDEELKTLRQVKAWMSDRPGAFDGAANDALACFLRGYAPLVNWRDHTYARLDAMISWRQAESIDTVLTDAAWVSEEAASLFAKAMPCGPIGTDPFGHAVVLETPGASTALLNQMFETLGYDNFLRCQIYNKEVLRAYVASLSLAEKKRLYKVVNVVDLSGFGAAHMKGTMMTWFKQYAGCFGLNYPETMYRTYIINAPMLFTGIWKIARNFIHPVTAAKISVSSWGHEAVFKKDGIALFDASIKSSLRPWRAVATSLASSHDLATLACGCYMPPEDVAALAALEIMEKRMERCGC